MCVVRTTTLTSTAVVVGSGSTDAVDGHGFLQGQITAAAGRMRNSETLFGHADGVISRGLWRLSAEPPSSCRNFSVWFSRLMTRHGVR